MKLFLLSICFVCVCVVFVDIVQGQSVVCYILDKDSSCESRKPGGLEGKSCGESMCQFERVNGVVEGNCLIEDGLEVNVGKRIRVDKRILDESEGHERLLNQEVNCGAYRECWCDTKGIAVPEGRVLLEDGCDVGPKIEDFIVVEFFPDTNSRRCRKVQPDPGPGPEPVVEGN